MKEKPNALINYHEHGGLITWTLKKTTLRYVDEFLRLNCAVDMLELKLFPNGKEITESFGAFNAVRKGLKVMQKPFDLADKDVHLFSVGDGGTPRTASTFAFRTGWQCHSIDPHLKDNIKWQAIKRLKIYPGKVQEYKWNVENAVIVHVHSHANLVASLQSIEAKKYFIVAIPCCVEQNLDLGCPFEIDHYYEYEDWGINSEKRKVKVWIKN